MQSVGGQFGGVELARAEATELVGNLPSADPRRSQNVAPAYERDRGASGRGGGAATAGVKAGVGHPRSVQT